MPVDVEHHRTDALLGRVGRIEAVADTLPAGDPRRRALEAVVEDELSAADAVRPIIAADLLGLTEKTVRTWVREGILTVRTDRPRLLLDPTRLHEVLKLVGELREAGKDRRLQGEVYRRLSDAAVRDRPDLEQSIAEMHQGQGRVVRGAALTLR